MQLAGLVQLVQDTRNGSIYLALPKYSIKLEGASKENANLCSLNIARLKLFSNI